MAVSDFGFETTNRLPMLGGGGLLVMQDFTMF